MVYQPFQLAFWLLLAMEVVVIVLLTRLLGGLPMRKRRIALGCLSLLAITLFVLSKLWHSQDPVFMAYYFPDGYFNILKELPLHLCSIGIFVLPIAILTNSRLLLGCCCVFGVAGSLAVQCSPVEVFLNRSLLLPSCIGFYGYHFMAFVNGFLVFTLELYQPKLRDAPVFTLLLLGFSQVVHLINFALRQTGLAPDANYFFTYGTEGAPWLDFFYNLLPVRSLYLLLVSPLALVLSAAVILFMLLLKKLAARRAPLLGKELAS